MKAAHLLLIGLLLATPLRAAPATAEFKDHPDLPPLVQVTAAMTNYPTVLAAKSGIKVGEANRTRLQAGPYEVGVRLGTARRRVEDPFQRLAEWDVGVERPLRLPGKARIDAELGDQGVAQAGLAYGDALHEAGRTLLKMWFAWVREHAQVRQWQNQAAVLMEQLETVNKRMRAGDAPQLEAGMAEAALAQAESSLKQAESRERVAANDITLRFSGIALPPQPPLVAPQPLEQGLDYWREQILQHNHELGLARAEAKRAQLVAARAGADTTPDPTVGIRYSSELGGAERVAGLSIVIPFPGQARSAVAAAAQAQTEAAAQREATVVRKLNAEAANNFAQARAAYESWQSMRTVAERIQRNAELMGRAYSLGETGLLDVLTARRQAIETQLTTTLAQLDAAEARYRLLLDAHQLWPLDVDEGDAEHAHY